jgi:hypothetical protein
MAAFDIGQYFNSTLQGLLTALSKPLRPGTKFQLTVTGPSGGVWYVDTTGGTGAVSVTPLDSIDCSMTIADTDFMNVMTATAGPSTEFIREYMAGKVVVTGSVPLAVTRFARILSLR